MPKIKLALYDHPFRQGIETIRATKTNVQTGWVPLEDLCVELVDLGNDPLSEREEMLVFKTLRTVLANHDGFTVSIGELPGIAKGDPNGVGDDALSEGRLFIKSKGFIEALRRDLKQALIKAGITRIIDQGENYEMARTPEGGMERAGPFMIVSKIQHDKMTDKHIEAVQKLAYYLSKFTITTPVSSIVLDPGFGGRKYLLKLQNRPKNTLSLAEESAAVSTGKGGLSLNASQESKTKADTKSISERQSQAKGFLPLTDEISVNFDIPGGPTRDHRMLGTSETLGSFDRLQQLRYAKSIEITNKLVDCIIEINEDDEKTFKEKMSEIVSLTNNAEYNPDLKYAPEKLTPTEIAKAFMKIKTFNKLVSINEARKAVQSKARDFTGQLAALSSFGNSPSHLNLGSPRTDRSLSDTGLSGPGVRGTIRQDSLEPLPTIVDEGGPSLGLDSQSFNTPSVYPMLFSGGLENASAATAKKPEMKPVAAEVGQQQLTDKKDKSGDDRKNAQASAKS